MISSWKQTLHAMFMGTAMMMPFAMLAGCESDGPVENAAENVDDAGEEVGDNIEEATD